MLRKKIGTTLATCGVLMIIFGISTLPAPEVASAMPAPQPSPRPTIVATPKAGDPAGGAATAEGHVTGTVIDLNTGAPVAGLSVNVGGTIVTTDANGNYDHWAPVGVYSVTLVLTPDQGVPAQDPQTVQVNADSATVQHLNFRAKAAGSTPAAATSVPADQAAAPAANMPKRLPRTGEESNNALLWMIAGMGLLMAGAVLGLGSGAGRGFGALRPAPVVALARGPQPRQAAIQQISAGRRRARSAPAFDSAALLSALLATEPPPARVREPKVENAALLRSLLEREV